MLVLAALISLGYVGFTDWAYVAEAQSTEVPITIHTNDALIILPSHHFWLTNKTNAPAAINRASRVPTANERARFRPSSGFDPAPFCAAPRPNQKRSLSIAVSAVIGAVLWGPYYAYGYGCPYSASAKSRNPARKRRDLRQLDFGETLVASASDAEKDAPQH